MHQQQLLPPKFSGLSGSMQLKFNPTATWSQGFAVHEGKRIANELKTKHTNRCSACGVLLSEIVQGVDLSDRVVAAMSFGYLKCRRGVKQLRRTALELAKQIDGGGVAGVYYSTHRQLLNSILWAVAGMDTPQSHAVLVKLLEECRDQYIRGDVLEVMSREEKMLDKSLLLPFLSVRAEPPEITSALYTLESTDYVNRNWRDALRRVTPLLEHPVPYVRSRAIFLLGWRRKNRDLVFRMLDDPDPGVREYAQQALEIWHEGPISH
jgi:hypothetical protein